MSTIDGGLFAKKGFRFQDWCAMYFTLSGYIQESPFIFEYIYCEQEKLDFEIWNSSEFNGYQIKTNASNISAKEANQIFDFYYKKATTSQKKYKKFRFVFCENPKNSLLHLLLKLSGNSGVNKYSKTTQKYISKALTNINTKDLVIDHCCYKEEDIRAMVFSTAGNILKSRIKKNEDFTSEMIINFIARFREEIDKISVEVIKNDRVYKLADIETLISNFLSTTKLVNYSNEGKKRKIINYADTKPVKRVVRLKPSRLESPVYSADEGGKIKS